MKHRVLSGLTAICLLATPAVADDTAASDQPAGLLKILVDTAKSNTAAGATTVDATAGEIEAKLLTAGAVGVAAKRIVAALQSDQATVPHRILLLTGDSTVNLGLPAAFDAELEYQQAMVDQANRPCSLKRSASPVKKSEGTFLYSLESTTKSFGGPIVGAAATILPALLKTDTTVSGVKVEADDRLLADAILAADTKHSISMIDDVSAPSSETRQQTKFRKLLDARDALLLCRDGATEAEAKPLDLAIKRVADFHGAVTKLDADGTSLLSRVARIDAVNKTNVKILRVRTSSAGGTMIKRSNLFTMLGAKAVAISGGLIVSYRLTNPVDGTPSVAGTLACRTTLADIRDVHKTGRKDGVCE